MNNLLVVAGVVIVTLLLWWGVFIFTATTMQERNPEGEQSLLFLQGIFWPLTWAAVALVMVMKVTFSLLVRFTDIMAFFGEKTGKRLFPEKDISDY